MSVKPRGKGYQVDVKLGDARYRPTFDTEAEARTWEEDARHAFKMGRPIPVVPTTVTQGGGRVGNMRDLLDLVKVDWELDNSKSVDKMYRNGEMFLEWFGEKRHPSEVSDTTFDEYVSHLRTKRGNSGATINRKLSPVRMMLKKARKRKMISEVPDSPLFDETKGSLNWLDFGQEEPVLAHLKHRAEDAIHDLVIVLTDTGARISEALRVGWRTIRATVVVFEDRKNGSMMGLPLTKRAQEALARRRQFSKDPERPFGDIDYAHARKVLREIYATLGEGLGGDIYRDITQPFHVYRHSCASRLAVRGVDARRIKEWMDHASMVTTMRYMKLAPSALELAAAALEPEASHPALRVVSDNEKKTA